MRISMKMEKEGRRLHPSHVVQISPGQLLHITVHVIIGRIRNFPNIRLSFQRNRLNSKNFTSMTSHSGHQFNLLLQRPMCSKCFCFFFWFSRKMTRPRKHVRISKFCHLEANFNVHLLQLHLNLRQWMRRASADWSAIVRFEILRIGFYCFFRETLRGSNRFHRIECDILENSAAFDCAKAAHGRMFTSDQDAILFRNRSISMKR